MVKINKVFFFCFLLPLLLASCGNIGDKKVAYLGHSLPVTHPVHKGMAVFASEVDRLSSGKLTIKIFPDAQLGSEREVLELLQIGSIPMTKVNTAVMANFAPGFKVFGVPYLFRDKEHLFNVLEGDLGKEILASGRENLLKGMSFYDAGSRSFYTKSKPIRKPEDLKGLKIRVMNHQMSLDMVNAMGGSATPMAYGELYTALQQGVVDGAENNPPSFVTSRQYEVCKYYTLDEHTALPDVMVISTKFWDKLSDEEQAWMEEAASNSLQAQKEFWRVDEEKCLQILKEANVEIIRPDKTLFAEKAKSILANLKDDKELMKMITKIKTEY